MALHRVGIIRVCPLFRRACVSDRSGNPEARRRVRMPELQRIARAHGAGVPMAGNALKKRSRGITFFVIIF
jgi:hypothetical protein